MGLTRAEYQEIYTDGGTLPLKDEPEYHTHVLVDSESTDLMEAQFQALKTAGYRRVMKDQKRYWRVSLHIEPVEQAEHTAFHTRHRR